MGYLPHSKHNQSTSPVPSCSLNLSAVTLPMSSLLPEQMIAELPLVPVFQVPAISVPFQCPVTLTRLLKLTGFYAQPFYCNLCKSWTLGEDRLIAQQRNMFFCPLTMCDSKLSLCAGAPSPSARGTAVCFRSTLGACYFGKGGDEGSLNASVMPSTAVAIFNFQSP